MIPLPRWVYGVAFVLVALVAAGVFMGGRITNRWKEDAAAWKDSTRVFRDSVRITDSTWRNVHRVALDQFIDSTERLVDRLKASTSYASRIRGQNDRLLAEANALREQRDNLIIVSTDPGRPPTVGDTLASCRVGRSLCEQEIAIHKQRVDSATAAVDSLLRVAAEATIQMHSAREDAMTWRQSWEMDRRLLQRADSLLAAGAAIIDHADPPCYIWRVAFVRIHCLGRKDTAGLAIAGTLGVSSLFVKDERVAQQFRYAAGGFVLGSIVIW